MPPNSFSSTSTTLDGNESLLQKRETNLMLANFSSNSTAQDGNEEYEETVNIVAPIIHYDGSNLSNFCKD